jgi:probable HAF family extracellular repeat protein
MSTFVTKLSKHTPVTVRLILVTFLGTWPAASRAQVYTITDLGIIGPGLSPGNPPFSAGFGINASGQVAGQTTSNPAPSYHAFRTTPTGLATDPGADLGVLPGGFWTDSSGSGINSSGQVTGYCASNLSVSAARAVRTTATGRISDPGTDLGALPGLPDSYGVAINALGQVTGFSTVHDAFAYPQATHAYRTTATGTLTDPAADLGVFPGGLRSYGYGINDAGQVAGYSEYAMGTTTSSGPTRAFRTSPTGRVTDPGADLGTLGGSTSQAFAINNAGQVTGSSLLPGDTVTHAFRSSPNGQAVSLTDLGTLGTGSVGMAINSSGMVVGNYGDGIGQHAFLYDTQMRDLTALLPSGSGWILTYAYGINDVGQITGIGKIGGIGGQEHAFRLTPVPEPGALILLAAPAAVWSWRQWRRHRLARRPVTDAHPSA